MFRLDGRFLLASLWLIAVIFTCTPRTFALEPENTGACATALEQVSATVNPLKHKPSIAKLESELKNKAAAGLTPEQMKIFDEVVQALYFIDYKHQSADLLAGLRGKNVVGKMKFPNSYSQAGLFGTTNDAPFKNFIEAQEFIRNSNRPLDLDFLKDLHRILMKNGVEDFPDKSLGAIRNKYIYGNALHWITAEQRQTILDNPYLNFKTLQEKDGKFLGQIVYPFPTNVKAEALERIKDSNPDVYNDIVKFKASRKPGDAETVAPAELTARLVTSLIEERLRWLVLQRDQLGDPDNLDKLRTYIRLGAEFQEAIISIHVFDNGNGRTSREFLYAFLRQQDIPPPRIIDPNDDVERSRFYWDQEVESGIAATERLYEDLAERLRMGLPIEYSPTLVFPEIVQDFNVRLKHEKPEKQIVTRTARIDDSQFLTFVKTRMEGDAGFDSRLAESPLETVRKLNEEYGTFLSKHLMDYDHPKDGREEISLNFVDPDFVSYFANQAARNPRLWNAKMNRWYRDELVWRGLSYRDRQVSEEDVCSMFKNLSGHLLSMHSVKYSGSENLIRSINDDFQRYNRDLVSGDVFKVVYDHTTTGPAYADSYGFSTSKNETVGKAYAMGAMVVAPYGQQMQFQHLLKSRVNIGMKRAKFYVDAGRLHQFRPDFTYKYGRQQEVMGIGAADPDSVMTVFLYDAEGRVETTYARNPADPSKVWVVRGRFDSTAETPSPSPETIVKVIDLYPNQTFEPKSVSFAGVTGEKSGMRSFMDKVKGWFGR